jgi:membrane fusion protein, multidrug efflux system
VTVDQPAARGRRRGVVAAAVLAVAATVAAVTVVLRAGGGDGGQQAAAGPEHTTQVRRVTLVQTDEVHGTLGHGAGLPLVNRLAGTLTAMAAAGTVVRRGEQLYGVDARPVVLMYGPVPTYRELAPGVVGPDVAQFEQNLRELGYTGYTVDDTYSAATAEAVVRWQEDIGLPETGVIELGRVVFLPGEVRVAGTDLHVGGIVEQDGPALDYTGTERVVVADVEVATLTGLAAGTPVTVLLPGRVEVAATVRSFGAAADAGDAAEAAASDGGEADGPPTVPVTVVPGDQAAVTGMDGVPVSVRITGDSRENVLAVPVAALLALREGGYGVQLVEGGVARVVAVTTGMFASGLVEVTGDGLTDGMTVGMPRP